MNADASQDLASHAAAPPMPNRRHYALLTLFFVFFIVYGSIVPLRLHRQTFAAAVERFQAVLSEPIAFHSRSDWLANFLLQLPFGFVLMAAICCDRPFFTLPALAVTFVSCIALAGCVEFAQLYFPPRVASINDIVAQTIGGTCGAVSWLIAGQGLTNLARLLWRDIGSRSTAFPLLGVYFFIVLVLQTLPFDFTLSPVEIYHKYKEGRVYLRPFTSAGVGGFELANKHFWNVALFVPIGVLAAFLPGRIKRSGLLVFGLGLLAAGTIEFAQLLAFTRYFDTTDIVTGSTAVFGAWFFTRRFVLPNAGQSERSSMADGMALGLLAPSHARLRMLLMTVCIAALIYMEWQPFDFDPSLSQAKLNLRKVSLMPFLDYLGDNYIGVLDDVLHKILLYAPLGVFLAPASPASRTTIVFRWSLAIAVAVTMETGQLFLPTRYSSISDVIVAGCASGVAMMFVLRARALAPQSQRSVCEFSR